MVKRMQKSKPNENPPEKIPKGSEDSDLQINEEDLNPEEDMESTPANEVKIIHQLVKNDDKKYESSALTFLESEWSEIDINDLIRIGNPKKKDTNKFKDLGKTKYDEIIASVDNLWGLVNPDKTTIVEKIWTIITLLLQLGSIMLKNDEINLGSEIKDKFEKTEPSELETRLNNLENSLPEKINNCFKAVMEMGLADFKETFRKHTTHVKLIIKNDRMIDQKALEEFKSKEKEITAGVEARVTQNITKAITENVIDDLEPKMKQKIKDRTEEIENRLQESKSEADKGNMEDRQAIWPNKHLMLYDAKQIGGLSDSRTLAFMEPIFSVMGNSFRTLMLTIGFINEKMEKRQLAINLRALLIHYSTDLTTNEPNGRMITEIICSHLQEKWMELVNILIAPGDLNKTTVGKILNKLLTHLDGEILPSGNDIVRQLLTLKAIMAPEHVPNTEVLLEIAKLVGPTLNNELTTGRILKNGQLRDDVGRDFNIWKKNSCHKFPERAIVDLRLNTDRHKVAAWCDQFCLEAKSDAKRERKGKQAH